MTSNELRQVMGLKPSSDPKADQLINSNFNQPEGKVAPAPTKESPKNKSDKEGENQNG
jgi:hypothetical protein